MKQISFIDSLVSFNQRVLYQGTPKEDKKYSITELTNLLFFNSIFYKNMEEIFSKYNTKDIIDKYVKSLSQYINNVKCIISMMNSDYGINIDDTDLFERRFAMESQLKDIIIDHHFQIGKPIDFKFDNSQIYYISKINDKYFSLSYIDRRMNIYKDPLGYISRDSKTFWKTDNFIRDYLGEAVAIKITTSDRNPFLITKVEYNGDKKLMQEIASIFHGAVIISNKFIYTDDIKHILEENNSDQKKIHMQRFSNVDIDDYFIKDDLIEYPRDSFEEYLQLLRSASQSDRVESMYLTLYRIGDNPSIFYILRDAVNKGIDVNVNIELCASGEESKNAMWMREMEDAGIKVTTYGFEDIKVHTKLTLINFRKGKSIAQIGTGNYNYDTTTQYTDLSFITSDPDICSYVQKVFNILNGEENVSFDENFLVTRYNAKEELIRLIDEECDKGIDGFISIKCNSLNDPEIIQHLDDAANVGCTIEMIIRGVCTWVPKQLGMNVRIKSVIWDKLEHSRVYCFNKYNPSIYIGSLDLVTKKIEKRIETLVKINDPEIIMKICKYLNRYINTSEGWLLKDNGEYVKEME